MASIAIRQKWLRSFAKEKVFESWRRKSADTTPYKSILREFGNQCIAAAIDYRVRVAQHQEPHSHCN